MGFVINFGGYDRNERPSYDPLPPGEYKAVLDLVEFVPPKQDKNFPYLNLTFVITEEGEFNGRKAWDIISFSPAASDFFLMFLDGLGVNPSLLNVRLVEDEDNPGRYVDCDLGLEWGAESAKGRATVLGLELADNTSVNIAGLPVTVKLVIDNNDQNDVEYFYADGVTLPDNSNGSTTAADTSAKTKTRSSATRSTPSSRRKKSRPGARS